MLMGQMCFENFIENILLTLFSYKIINKQQKKKKKKRTKLANQKEVTFANTFVYFLVYINRLQKRKQKKQKKQKRKKSIHINITINICLLHQYEKNC